jgi:uncharacterized membrane protein YfcA
VVHGIFFTGGPLAVYVLGREVEDKGVFRSTLAVLWLVLDFAFIVGWRAGRPFPDGTWRLGLVLLPALVVGALAGDRLHGRLDPARFKVAVFTLLAGAGVLLLRSGLLS